MTNKTFEQQAETGKRMSWVGTAARLAPLVGALGVMGAGAARVQRDQRDVAAGRAVMARANVQAEQGRRDVANRELAQRNEHDAMLAQEAARQEAARQQDLLSRRIHHNLFRAYQMGRPQVGEFANQVSPIQRGLVARSATPAGRRERARYRNEL